MDLSLQDAVLLDRVVDVTSKEYKYMMELLLRRPDDGKDKRPSGLDKAQSLKYVLQYRGDPESETAIESLVPVTFSDRASYRNGVASLALTAVELLDLIAQSSSRKRFTGTMVVSDESPYLYDSVVAAGSDSGLIQYVRRVNLVREYFSAADKCETMVFDHTTVNVPIDELLNFSYKAGIRVVDGVFPYHAAAVRGWDTVAGVARWSYTHSGKMLTVGPDDDPSRLMKYKKTDYAKFVDPKLWKGYSRQYVYEIRKVANGLAVYRAVFVGDTVANTDRSLSFKLPLCTSESMVLITINKQLAAGAFVSRSNNAVDLTRLDKDYAIEVRRDLFVSCVNYLISMTKGADIVGDAIRYIYQHNYVDLMDGVRVVRCQSLSYADGLCVAMVCALTAFSLRYRLTAQSIPVINKARKVARLADYSMFGALGRIAWLFFDFLNDAANELTERAIGRAMRIFASTDLIPGVCYDVYMDYQYQVDGTWFEPHSLEVQTKDLQSGALLRDDDPFVGFLGDNVAAYNPTVHSIKIRSASDFMFQQPAYQPNLVADPISVWQDAYDEALPQLSTAQLQNVAELRRVKDVNINTEFYGKIEINKDIAAPERLHVDMPLRTAALHTTRTPLLDALMASAKRNFNPPDLQMQTAVYDFARTLVDEFIDNCFIPGFSDTIGKSYSANPMSLNVSDYMEWLANKDTNYRSALESEMPDDMVFFNLNKFDTIVKKRIKPKLSVSAQYELAQPQVIVSLSKTDTAPFTSIFRQIFDRFDSALRPQFMSAGRSSDDDISRWLTDHRVPLLSLVAMEIDSGKYDKSQGLLARLIEAIMMQRLGLDPGVSEIFQDSFVGKVSSKTLGLAFVSAYQMKSGAPDTMLGNLVYNFVSAGRSVGYHNIEYMIAKGDDNVIWLRSDISASLVVSKMSNLFNLECKLIIGSVLYFSSGYVVPVDEFMYFVSDPLKLVELQGERASDDTTLDSQFQSFKDRVAGFCKHSHIPTVLQQVVRSRYGGVSISVVDIIDAACAVAQDFGLYRKLRLGYTD